VRPAEVLARSVGEDGDLGLSPDDAVHDLVQGPVAADDDDQLALRRRVARKLRQVAGPFRQQLVAVEAELLRPVVELRPALRGRAVRARRVDEEDGLVAQP
jgi:hypothetical protein